MHHLSFRGGAVALFGALAAVPLVVGVLGWLADWPLGMDSAVYRAGALTLLHGDPLYDTDTLAFEPEWAQLPFTYPPAAALLFVPLAAFAAPVAWGMLGAISIVAAGLVVVLSIRAARATHGTRAPGVLGGGPLVVVAITVAVLLLEPVWRTVSLGQVNLILLALILVDVLVLTARGNRAGGVLIGVAAAVKLTPLIFVPHLLFTGRWRDALRAVATFVALQAAMLALIPHDVVRYWTRAVSDPTRIGTIHWSDNQALNGLALRLTEQAPWSITVALGIGALLAPPAVWLMLRYHRSGDELRAVLVTAGYGLLISPVSWTHHWVWVIPLLVTLLAGVQSPVTAAPKRLATLAAVLVVFGSYVLLILPGGRDPDGWSVLDHVLGNAYLYVPLALGAAAFVKEWRRPQARRPPTGVREVTG
ncbi:glycosyltransferase 87 family protein [Haloechinothrix halophila]|uniref:glycosyltransferase 87 family protein n=1 Tax=Haloechinothrix halophila TaxID=1069073 RepID=UPI00041658BD|nr:glycosyltransferase 87 family protein [Haloechinothrix halophila]